MTLLLLLIVLAFFLGLTAAVVLFRLLFVEAVTLVCLVCFDTFPGVTLVCLVCFDTFPGVFFARDRMVVFSLVASLLPLSPLAVEPFDRLLLRSTVGFLNDLLDLGLLRALPPVFPPLSLRFVPFCSGFSSLSG